MDADGQPECAEGNAEGNYMYCGMRMCIMKCECMRVYGKPGAKRSVSTKAYGSKCMDGSEGCVWMLVRRKRPPRISIVTITLQRTDSSTEAT